MSEAKQNKSGHGSEVVESTNNPMFNEVAQIEVDPSQDEKSVKEEQQTEETCKTGLNYILKLKENATLTNFFVVWLCAFVLGFSQGFLFNFQNWLLLNKQGQDAREFTKEVERTDTVQQLASLVFALTFGHFSDKCGRKIFMCFGFLLMSVALISAPFTENTYYEYSSVYVLFGIGAVTVFVMTLTSVLDYVHYDFLGRGLAIIFLAWFVGHWLGGWPYSYVAVEQLCINGSYGVAGGVSLLIGLIAPCGLQSDRARQADVGEGVGTQSGHFFKIFWELLKNIKKNDKRVAVAFLAAPFAFGANIVSKFFYPGWMPRTFERTLCNFCFSFIPGPDCYTFGSEISTCDEDISDQARIGCPAGQDKVLELLAVFVPVQIFVCLLFLTSDLANSLLLMFFTSVLSIISFSLVLTIEGYDMLEDSMKTANFFWALMSALGLLVASLLLAKSTTFERKGLVVGTFVAFMQVGALFTHGLGGYLFGTYSIGSPWLVVMWLSVLPALVSLALFIYERMKKSG